MIHKLLIQRVTLGIIALLVSSSCSSASQPLENGQEIEVSVSTIIPSPTTSSKRPTATSAEPTRPALSTPTLPSSADAIPHLVAGESVNITYINMMDATVGWAIGGTNGNGDHVLRTSDGGNSWQDITPPELALSGEGEEKVAIAHFVSADTAWITYFHTDRFIIPSNPIVWRTFDGGENWAPSSPLPTVGDESFYVPFVLFFADPQNGWLLVQIDRSMNHDYAELFKTSDGGIIWERIVDPYTPYLQGCTKNQLVFADGQTGFVTCGYLGVYMPAIDWTEDGGLTWESKNLPTPDEQSDLFQGDYSCESHSPVLFSPQSGYFALTCRLLENFDVQQHYLYYSSNSGQNWQITPYPGGEVTWLDKDVGWALSRDIYLTRDSGNTWAMIKTVYWDGQFSFVDEQLGWAVARGEGEIALVTTTNGGQLWAQLEPVVSP